jgi:hypothetical protein
MWQSVEARHVTHDDLRNFVFAIPVTFCAATNPDFSRASAIEGPLKAAGTA